MAQILLQGAKPIFSSEVLTIDNTTGGVALTATKYRTFNASNNDGVRKATMATITIETAPIRVSLDPAVTVTDASTGVGHLFQAGDTIELNSISQLVNFRAVRSGAVSAVLQISYWEG